MANTNFCFGLVYTIVDDNLIYYLTNPSHKGRNLFASSKLYTVLKITKNYGTAISRKLVSFMMLLLSNCFGSLKEIISRRMSCHLLI